MHLSLLIFFLSLAIGCKSQSDQLHTNELDAFRLKKRETPKFSFPGDPLKHYTPFRGPLTSDDLRFNCLSGYAPLASYPKVIYTIEDLYKKVLAIVIQRPGKKHYIITENDRVFKVRVGRDQFDINDWIYIKFPGNVFAKRMYFKAYLLKQIDSFTISEQVKPTPLALNDSVEIGLEEIDLSIFTQQYASELVAVLQKKFIEYRKSLRHEIPLKIRRIANTYREALVDLISCQGPVLSHISDNLEYLNTYQNQRKKFEIEVIDHNEQYVEWLTKLFAERAGDKLKVKKRKFFHKAQNIYSLLEDRGFQSEHFDPDLAYDHLVFARKGLLYFMDGTLVDGEFIFVMSPRGLIFMSPDRKIRSDLKKKYKYSGGVKHSCFLRGAKVAAAGNVTIEKGKIIDCDGGSGHYLPKKRHQIQFVRHLDFLQVERKSDLTCAY